MTPMQAEPVTVPAASDLSSAPDDENADEESRRRAALRGRHRLVLAGVALVLCGSLSLEVVGDGRIAMRGLEAYPLPHTCAARYLLEQGCPACGLTRSFIHLANGRWQQSLAVHRLGWLLAALLVLQIPYRAAGLLGRNPSPVGVRLPIVIGYTVGILFAANWCYGLLV